MATPTRLGNDFEKRFFFRLVLARTVHTHQKKRSRNLLLGNIYEAVVVCLSMKFLANIETHLEHSLSSIVQVVCGHVITQRQSLIKVSNFEFPFKINFESRFERLSSYSERNLEKGCREAV